MDANGHKVPLARIMTVAEFHRRFGTQEACVEHLRKVRWGEGLERFVCPACGHTQGWWLVYCLFETSTYSKRRGCGPISVNLRLYSGVFGSSRPYRPLETSCFFAIRTARSSLG